MKLHEKLLVQWTLQRPPSGESEFIKGVILTHFRKMYNAYFRDIKDVPQESLINISYQDLVTSPVKTLERVYKQLNLPDFEKLRPELDKYESLRKEYKVNEHPPISDVDKKKVQEMWGDYFDYFGYKK